MGIVVTAVIKWRRSQEIKIGRTRRRAGKRRGRTPSLWLSRNRRRRRSVTISPERDAGEMGSVGRRNNIGQGTRSRRAA
jgi:hypothetical protein